LFVLTIQPGNIRVDVTPGDTLDEALEKAGWYRPWGGCRVGGCGSCAARLIDPSATFAGPSGDLGLRGESGFRHVLMCCAVPTSDVTLTIRVGLPRRRE
jgi:ferredoxin